MASAKTPGGRDLNGARGNCFLVGDALRRQTDASAAADCDNRQQAIRMRRSFDIPQSPHRGWPCGFMRGKRYLKELAAAWPVTESSGALRHRHRKDGGRRGELMNLPVLCGKITS
jgi:hypothetical protein